MSALRINDPRTGNVRFIDLGPATPISRGQAPGGRIVRGAPGSNTEHHRTAEHRRVVQRVEVCE